MKIFDKNAKIEKHEMMMTMRRMRMMMIRRMKRKRKRKRQRDGEREERDGKRKQQRERQRGRETPNNDALAQAILKITIGCLCRGPSRRFQGACRFQHPQKKTCSTVGLFGPCCKTGRKETRKNACM